MFLKQYYLACLAHASYLIADETTKTAIVVDPQRDVDQYLADAAEHGFEIRHVFLTHFHADFVAGHLELRERTGATIHLGAKAQADYPFVPAKDGDRLTWGRLALEILETPGHTPEGISIVVHDLDHGDQPRAVLTGDTLFIGDVGRPDLMASIGISAEELAGLLYDSLHQKLMKLPDDTLLYPAHGAGSMCGKNLSRDTVSTIGAQRATNYALQPMSKEAFIAMATSELPKAPQYFSYDAMFNRRERGTLEDNLATLKALDFETVLKIQREQEAQVVDARAAAAFAESHLSGSLNLGLGGSYATWAGTLLDPQRPIVLIAESGHEVEAAMRLGRIGFDRVAGFLDGGGDELDKHPEHLKRLPRISSAQLRGRLESAAAPTVLDVRTPGEWQGQRIAGSINVPLNELPDRLDEVPREGALIVMCRTGYRSSAAASLLQAAGYDNLHDLVGGIVAWSESGASCTATGDASSTCSES
ncbi:MAG: MBL fold metallo-hydrolase [Planctomycetes bacterium]|nr:MBL fold metallo-hydrolase [Planctomycetota bacterium]